MPLPEFDLSGKVAFVTGAGRGIGKGIAEALAEAGADVVINSLTDKYVTGVAADLARATGRRVVSLVADVTKSDEVERAIGRIIKDFGALHVLVNNLGDSIRKPLVPLPGHESKDGPLTDEEYRLILDLNLTEAVLCTRAVGPHMLARRSGKIINIGSFASARGGIDLTIYSAAKTALVGFTRALALEWAPYGVRVNAIAPGPIPTEGVRKAFTPSPSAEGKVADVFAVEKAMEAYARKAIPAGRWGSPRDIANMVAYLASPAGEWITGAIMVVDGGEWLARNPAPSAPRPGPA
jgi:peroxisomal 2,4-dienoyl-CoA reductase